MNFSQWVSHLSPCKLTRQIQNGRWLLWTELSQSNQKRPSTRYSQSGILPFITSPMTLFLFKSSSQKSWDRSKWAIFTLRIKVKLVHMLIATFWSQYVWQRISFWSKFPNKEQRSTSRSITSKYVCKDHNWSTWWDLSTLIRYTIGKLPVINLKRDRSFKTPSRCCLPLKT